MGTIEDLLNKAEHSKHQKKAGRIQEKILKYANVALIKHYKNGLSKEDLEKFKELSDEEQLEQMADKDFKLGHHDAEDYLNGLAHVAIKAISPKFGEDYKKHLKVLKDKDADADKKAEALRHIDTYKVMLTDYDIDLNKIKQAGMKIGFSSGLINDSLGKFGETWLQKTQRSYVDQIHADDVDKYIKKLTEEDPFKNLNHDLVKSQPYEQKRELVISHIGAKKRKDSGGIEDFLEKYKDYFVKPKK